MRSKFTPFHYGSKFTLAIVLVVAIVIASSYFLFGYRPKVEPQPSQGAEQSVEQTIETAPADEIALSLNLASVTVMQEGEFAISIDGLAPGEPAVFRVSDGQDSFTEIGRGKANAQGKISGLAVELPDWITSGERTLEVEGLNSGRTTEMAFFVRAPKPWINLGSYAAKQDTSMGLTAGGFEPGENVHIFFEQQPQDVLISTTADLAGNVSWSEIALRGLRAGQYNLILQGETSQIKITEPIIISPRAPWADLHIYAIGPGGNVGFDGHDFAPGERIQIFLDEPVGTAIGQAIADEAGNFTIDAAYLAKPGDVGRHRIILVGELTGQNIVIPFDVTPFTPSFQMTTYSGPPGTSTSFNGDGFAPGETVKVYMQGQEQPVATIKVDSTGSFMDEGAFMVPRNVNGGNLDFTLVGDSSGAKLSQQFSVVRIQPFLGLDPYAGQPGTVVRFRGLGFAAGENVTIHVGNREGPKAATAVADVEGRFERSSPFTIPANSMQEVSFTAIGDESGAEAMVRFQVISPTPPGER